MRCGACQHDNPVNALYCAACGGDLRAAARAACAPRCRSGRFLALFGFVGFAALLGFTIFRAAGPSRIEVTLTLDLPAEKADAFFDMLAPDEVQVIVSREGHRIVVHGSDREITVLERFANLVTSLDQLSDDQAHAAIERMRPDWQEQARYDLPWAQREALLRLLSFDNVPLLVKRNGEQIRIQASRQDRRVIDSVVEILRGVRL